MPKPRAAKLETATARRRLPARKKPYWTTISPGVGLGYRCCTGPGMRSTDGHGSDWIKRIALADDFEPSDGRAVLNYWQIAASNPGGVVSVSLKGSTSLASIAMLLSK